MTIYEKGVQSSPIVLGREVSTSWNACMIAARISRIYKHNMDVFLKRPALTTFIYPNGVLKTTKVSILMPPSRGLIVN